ncbi:hypothetical protein P7D22_18575 [Lichenihabitans sp. Uapishka_5]|uniref:hypothetical protein n=1 Tax=Lichenihabitans sp. Uapishka_5 TaxID=3037302 RepID=UPI0029E7D4BB|nr:hypothetical protein [Lichenihabitans sp. Uapishka_5]MDX7953172.1 hypothetical protein [Lichenihabitans sp. Uapishka_5]
MALVLAAGLAGCVDNIPDVAVSRGDVRQAIARGTLKSPRPATVALASLDAGPGDTAARFKAVFDKAAAERDITLVEPQAARYLVRGYLSAAPGEHGTDVAYVYDVFDAAQRRMERVSDTLTLPAVSTDPWAAFDDRALASLAGRSADDLAVALASTPEAQAPQVASAH